MKKNLINRLAVMMVTSLLSLTAAGNYASAQSVKMNFSVQPDTPYLAEVTVMKTGFADTPYLSFNAQPVMLKSQLKNILFNQAGLFHIFIVYINNAGELLYEEDYYSGDDSTDAEINDD